ncbi:uncharacterized protein LOC132258308 isoform X2 [Phlebotomus argentipes]|uniref:uncharacterized protein LOC132258308 isoform X2 n=1 Tax=Phlebotomus argentipes TaxID=94469 RepID=UPI002892A4BA|nr:uncharacterized protein LOC132258308 isoform X2 [Phlebotomus argentipes]
MSLGDFERYLAFIPIFCIVMLICVLVVRFFQYYIAPQLILTSQYEQDRLRNLQGHRFAPNYPRYPSQGLHNRPIPMEEIPSNTPYPMHNVMPMPQTSHLPQNSRLVNKKLVVCKIFPNEN